MWKMPLHLNKKSDYDDDDAFTIKYSISPLNFTLGQGQTQNVAQYPQHHIPMHLQSLKLLCPDLGSITCQLL